MVSFLKEFLGLLSQNKGKNNFFKNFKWIIKLKTINWQHGKNRKNERENIKMLFSFLKQLLEMSINSGCLLNHFNTLMSL